MSSRALSFGAIADAYERFRPGYPEEVFDLVASYAGRPVLTALETGAGTGKATGLFAQHVEVTASEPDLARRLVRGRDYRFAEWFRLEPLLAAYGRQALRM